jgi:hypothetical protein
MSLSVESYPPTLEDLRKSFLALHPEYEFGILVYKTEGGMEFRYQVPKEPVGGTSMCDDPCSDICHARGRRFQEWINYIYNQTKLMAAEANVTIALPKESELLPQRWTGDIFQPQPIQRLIRVEDAYFQLCHNPEVTPAKRLAREQAHKAKIRIEHARETELAEVKKRREAELAKAKEWATKIGWKCPARGPRIPRGTTSKYRDPLILSGIRYPDEDTVMLDAYRIARQHSKQILTLATKASLTKDEAKATMVYIFDKHIEKNPKTPPAIIYSLYSGYERNALLALKVLNRFATEHKIRVEDAITVFRGYIS